MLKEIHHRVKINLQVVTSLLRLQLYKIDDKTAAEPFQKSLDRIASMALLHETIYKGKSSLSAFRSGVKKAPFRLEFSEFEDEYVEIKGQKFYGFPALSMSRN
jgi:two-component sensor histidine kinase